MTLDFSMQENRVAPGEAFLADTLPLSGHAGTQPDLFLRWNAVPRGAAVIDVVVHLHGFSQQGRDMPLAEKVRRSGLELSRRARPTLALLPRGNWIRHTWYDFPALLDGGLDTLVDYGLARFGAALGCSVTLDRLILTAHSGGGMPAVDAIAGAHRAPDEFFVFDGLYGRADDPLGGTATVAAWLDQRLAAEPERPGALRVVYIERQTGPFSRALGDLLAARRAPPARYRVARSAVPHAYVADICGPQLLARADADIDWSV